MSTSMLERALRLRRWRREDAELVVAALEASAGPMTRFAAEHGVQIERLRRWRRRLRRSKERATPSSDEPIRFAPVSVVEAAPSPILPSSPPLTPTPAALEVAVGAAVVRVPFDFDEAQLQRLVRALASC